MAEAITELGLKPRVEVSASPRVKAVSTGGGRSSSGVADIFRGLVGLAGVFADTFAKEEERALRTYQDTEELTLNDNAARIFSINPNDAEAIDKNEKEFWSTHVETIPEPFRDKYTAMWTGLVNVAKAKAGVNSDAIARTFAINTNATLEGSRLGLWRGANRGVRSTNAATVNAAQEQVAILQAGFDLDIADLRALADPRGTIAEEIRRRTSAWNNEGLLAEAIGWFNEQPDKETAYLFMRDGGFVKGVPTDESVAGDDNQVENIQQFRIMDGMSQTYRDRALKAMVGDIQAVNAIDDRREQEAEKLTVERQNLNYSNEIGLVNDLRVEGRRIPDEDVEAFRDKWAAMQDNEDLKPAQRLGLANLIFSDPVIRTDQTLYSDLLRDGLRGEDIGIRIDKGVTGLLLGTNEQKGLRILDENNRKAALGITPGVRATKINTIAASIGSELSGIVDGALTPGAKEGILSRVNNGLLDFIDEATSDPDINLLDLKKRILDEIRPATMELLRGSLKIPYKSSKKNENITPEDVASSQGLLEKDRTAGLDDTPYNREKEVIFSWIQSFDEEELAKLKVAAAKQAKEDAEKARQNRFGQAAGAPASGDITDLGLNPIKVLEDAIQRVQDSLFRIQSGSPLQGEEPGSIAGPQQ